MTDKQTIIDRLLKIKELAVRGVDGEQAAAQKLLEDAMRKYGITESELTGGSCLWIRYICDGDDEIQLLWWLFKRVWYYTHTDDYLDYYRIQWSDDAYYFEIRMSAEEHAELAALYEHYRAGLARSISNLERSYKGNLSKIRQDLAEMKRRYLGDVEKRTEERKKLRKDYLKAKRNLAIVYVLKNGLDENNAPKKPLTITTSSQSDSKPRDTGRAHQSDYDYIYLAEDASEITGKPNELPALRIGEEELP